MSLVKTILITGGAGFIGKNLSLFLLKKYDNLIIHIFDNFISSYYNDFIKFKKINDPHNKIILFKYDITNSETMTFVKYNFKYDEIYHLASIASPIIYKKYPLETLNTGYIGTKNILDIALYHNSKILFTSTSEIYGDPTINTQNEDYYGNVNSFGARSCYDESKRVAESLCYTYINEFGLDIKIARIFNTYGPLMMINDGRIITEVIRCLINNKTLTIYGNGEQTRSCCYIDDTVEMLVLLMNNTYNKPVNIGNDTELSVNNIIKCIEKEYGKTVKKQFVQLTQNDPLKRKPCLKLNKALLKDIQITPFNNGIKKTIEYFKLY